MSSSGFYKYVCSCACARERTHIQIHTHTLTRKTIRMVVHHQLSESIRLMWLLSSPVPQIGIVCVNILLTFSQLPFTILKITPALDTQLWGILSAWGRVLSRLLCHSLMPSSGKQIPPRSLWVALSLRIFWILMIHWILKQQNIIYETRWAGKRAASR